jgi:hypothetical protein
MLEVSLLLAEFTKDFRNDILHDQCAIHDTVMPFYRFTDRFNSERSRQYERMF